MNKRTIDVNYLARVEGEGSLYVKLDGDEISELEFGIFEPPRFFEAFLQGRDFTEVPDITSRICGICPIGYQTSSINAMEDVCDVTVTPEINALRRLIYCGEWIESHVLHLFLLHAPDFLGYESAIHMAKDYPEEVQMGLRMKKIGNSVVQVVGGREIHPINMKMGGFYRAPTRRELRALVPELEWGLDAALRTVNLVSGFTFPELERDYLFVAMRHDDEYPMAKGRIVSSAGLNITAHEYEAHFSENHVERSNALHSLTSDGEAYHVGPMARFNLNLDLLTPQAAAAATRANLVPPITNPFKSIIVRAVEIVLAYEESLRIIAEYDPPDPPAVEVIPRAGMGFGVSEAPRGLLFHRYRIDDAGLIEEAKIVPPTSQNQPTIEADLHDLITANLALSDEDLTWQCEQAIRNYDPCISCATHFLDLRLDRG
ncbi:MAG: Ni/Fe hydrogenase subunit alpha [Acidimicrobiia bacterium]|nr:Ni/Fe hydrogenase subunit alpha [Acidimicrobiia bacterium]